MRMAEPVALAMRSSRTQKYVPAGLSFSFAVKNRANGSRTIKRRSGTFCTLASRESYPFVLVHPD